MKVQDVINCLVGLDPNLEVVIADQRPGTIGPSPSAICRGIDWDNGVVTIHPALPMTTIDMGTVKDMQKFAHENSWRQSYIREIGELKARIRALEFEALK